eukprot:jgi/Botrbrau1/6303/Bobra.0339s0014.1
MPMAYCGTTLSRMASITDSALQVQANHIRCSKGSSSTHSSFHTAASAFRLSSGKELNGTSLRASIRTLDPDVAKRTDANADLNDMHAPAASSKQEGRSQYPAIDQGFPGLNIVHPEPPVYVVEKFLTLQQCLDLREAALAGQLREVPYQDAVLLDSHRLWPLGLVVFAGGVTRATLAAAEGGSTTESLLAGAAGLAAWALAVSILALAGQAIAQTAIGGKGLYWHKVGQRQSWTRRTQVQLPLEMRCTALSSACLSF